MELDTFSSSRGTHYEVYDECRITFNGNYRKYDGKAVIYYAFAAVFFGIRIYDFKYISFSTLEVCEVCPAWLI